MSRRIANLASLLVLTLCACSPRYGDLDIDHISGDGDADNDSIEIEEGKVMLIRARPIAAGANQYERYDIVELESLNPSILFVEGARRVDQFIIGGVSAGETQILVRVNGYDEDEIHARVTSQVAP
jgi:hypothetical protein